MQEKKATKNKSTEEKSNFRSMISLNESLFEAIKVSIKTKNNDVSLKMIDNLTERPEIWVEFLSVALIWYNFPVVKKMIEKLGIDVTQVFTINASLFINEMYSEFKGNRIVENKDNYLNVECPLSIMAAIGGDIDTFNYIIDRGVNPCLLGHITLSRKLKNSVFSNLIGACAYYGKSELLHYVLEKHMSPKLDLNHKCVEKKSKIKQFSLIKDFSDFTPIHLSVANEATSQDDSIDTIKLLLKYGADLTLTDWNRDNLLHLATKFNKLRVVKFICEELKMHNWIEESNKEGQTPAAIAKSLQLIDILDYLEGYTTTSKNIEDELQELIEKDADKKAKKNKKKKKVETIGVYIGEYQETLKLPKPKEIKETPKVTETPHLTKEEEIFDYEKVDVEEPKHYERKSYYTNYDNNYNNNYGKYNNGYKNKSNRNYENDYNDYDYNYNKRDYNNYHRGNKKQYSNTNDNYTPKQVVDEGNSTKVIQPVNHNDKKSFDTIGLNTKEIKQVKVVDKDQPEIKQEVSKENAQTNKVTETKTENSIKNEAIVKTELEDPNDYEDDYIGEDNFITDENPEDNHVEEEPEKVVIANSVISELFPEPINHTTLSTSDEGEIKNLISKCLHLEKQLEKERKEKEELTNMLKSQKQSLKINVHPVTTANTEEKITDLLCLANEELSRQSKIIANLNEKLEFIDGKNIVNYKEDKLNELKDFYSVRLSLTVNTLNNFK